MEMINSIDKVYEKMYTSIVNEGYPLLDTIDKKFYEVLGKNEIGAMNIKLIDFFSKITFSLIILIVSIMIFKNLVHSIENREKENIYLILFKIGILYILSANTMFIIETIIGIFKNLNEIIIDFGKYAVGKDVCFSSLLSIISKFKVKGNDFFSIDGMINMAICYGTINIIINNSVKFVLFNLYIIISPIMIIFFYSKGTEKISKIWFKNIIYFMASQLIIKIILFFPLMYGKDDIVLKIILLGVLYLFHRIDMYLKELIL